MNDKTSKGAKKNKMGWGYMDIYLCMQWKLHYNCLLSRHDYAYTAANLAAFSLTSSMLPAM